jgi:signal peptidase
MKDENKNSDYEIKTQDDIDGSIDDKEILGSDGSQENEMIDEMFDEEKDSKGKKQDEDDFEDEEDEEEQKPFKAAAWDIIKDVAIAFIIVILIISSIYIYTGNWPPVVVVESDSMQHHDTESFLGVIDTGDLVLVKAIESENDIISYMKGKRMGHETYSEWGDVLIYRKNGYDDITPVIHRALIWLKYNETSMSFDIPELKYHNAPDEWQVLSGEQKWYNLSGSIILKEIGYDKQNVIINLGNILSTYNNPDIEPHSGFITLGDHNRGNYDQNMLPDGHGGRVRPIKPEWVVGKARGELPWFGLIKLYFQDNTITERAPQNSFTMLYVSLILIFAIPISIDIILIILESRKEKSQKKGKEEGEVKDDKKPRDKEPPPEDEISEDDLPPPEDEISEDDLPPPEDEITEEKQTPLEEEISEEDLPPPED